MTRGGDAQSPIDAIMTTDSWKQILFQDVVGAVKGGCSGFKYGSAFGPSGGVAGAVVGGILLGAANSGLWSWLLSAEMPKVENPIENWVNSDEIYDPLMFYTYYADIDEAFIESIAVKSNINLTMTKKCPLAVQVGVMHNAVLEKILSSEKIIPKPGLDTTSFAYQFITSEAFVSAWRSNIDDCIRGFKPSYDSAKSKLTPTAAQAIDLFAQVYMETPQTEEEVELVINTYYEKIEASTELSQQ